MLRFLSIKEDAIKDDDRRLGQYELIIETNKGDIKTRYQYGPKLLRKLGSLFFETGVRHNEFGFNLGNKNLSG